MNAMLTALFSDEEIFLVAHQLGSLKALGPDGFPGLFYHKFWQIVKGNIVGAAEKFRTGISHLRDLSKTHIALIPKVAAPECTANFRPISLCNNSYKILSKIMANRLKVILPNLIYEHHTTFVYDCQIQDNILIAHEVFHYLKLKKKGRNHEAALKVYMNKVYDRVDVRNMPLKPTNYVIVRVKDFFDKRHTMGKKGCFIH
ncbi:hypothetical protein CerSpe_092060 [Prunus speciosa]